MRGKTTKIWEEMLHLWRQAAPVGAGIARTFATFPFLCLNLVLACAVGTSSGCSALNKGGASGKLTVVKKADRAQKNSLIDELVLLLTAYTDEKIAEEFRKRAEQINEGSLTSEELRALLSKELTETLKSNNVAASDVAKIVQGATQVLTQSVEESEKARIESAIVHSLRESFQEFQKYETEELERVLANEGGAGLSTLVAQPDPTPPTGPSASDTPAPVPTLAPTPSTITVSELRFLSFEAVTGSAGQELNVQPEVAFTDSSGKVGNTVSAVTLDVFTAADCSGQPVDAKIWSIDAASRTSQSGVVGNFSGLVIHEPGTFYLKATARDATLGVKPACSLAVSVSPRNSSTPVVSLDSLPTEIRFLAATALTGYPGEVLSTKPQVGVYDFRGLISASAVVPLTINAHASQDCSDASRLTFGIEWQADAQTTYSFSGGGTFSGLSFESLGSYSLSVTSPGLKSACLPSVTIVEPAPSAVKLTGLPTLVSNGHVWDSIIRATVVDASGSRVNTSRTVSITAFSNSSCSSAPLAGLSGNSTGAVSGRATFDALGFTGAPSTTEIWLKAQSNGVESICMGPVGVATAVAAGLRFSSPPPTLVDAYTALGSSVVISLVDDSGATAQFSGADVTLSLHDSDTCTSPVADGLFCNQVGACVQGASAESLGTATFTGLEFLNPGVRYLAASAPGLSDACFGPIQIVAAGVVAQLSNLPSDFTRSPALNVTVGGSSVSSYKHLLLSGDVSCQGRRAQFDAIASYTSSGVPITDTLSNEGAHTLCVLGRSSTGTLQLQPTRDTFTRDVTPPYVVLSGLPSSGTQEPSLAVDVLGADLAEFRYAVVAGASCAGAPYGGWNPATETIRDPLFAGQQSLCVLGKDLAGNEQSVDNPTRYTFSVTGTFPPKGTLLVETINDSTLRVHTPRALPNTNFKLVYNLGSTVPAAFCTDGLTVANAGSGGAVVVTGLLPSATYTFRACVGSDSGSTGSGTTAISGQSSPLSGLCDSGDTDSVCTISSTKTHLKTGQRYVVAGDLIISPGADLRPAAGSELGDFELYVAGTLRVDGTLRGNFTELWAGDITVSASGRITAQGLGYQVGVNGDSGPGAGTYAAPEGQGGGHAGPGGAAYNGTYTHHRGYGLAFSPTTKGSAGGASSSSTGPGAGGGRIKLTAAATLLVEAGGVITAAAAASADSDEGGGAGGSVWMNVANLVGAGTIDVRGEGGAADATHQGGNGSGGRIAVHYTNISWTGSYLTGGGADAGDALDGASGTLALVDRGVATLILDGQGNGDKTAQTLLDFTTVDPGLATQRIAQVILRNGAVAEVADGTPVISIGNFTIEEGSSINETNLGYGLNDGPGSRGAGVHCLASSILHRTDLNSCGSAPFYEDPVFLSYYRILRPHSPGSGKVTPGGGAIWVEVEGDFTLDGELRSNSTGNTSGSPNVGSGGSIYIRAGRLFGNGEISNLGYTDSSTSEEPHGMPVHLEVTENHSDLIVNAPIGTSLVGQPLEVWTVNGFTEIIVPDNPSNQYQGINLTTPGRVDRITVSALREALFFGKPQVLEIGEIRVAYGGKAATVTDHPISADTVYLNGIFTGATQTDTVHVIASDIFQSATGIFNLHEKGYGAGGGPGGGIAQNGCRSGGGHVGLAIAWSGAASDGCLGLTSGAVYGNPMYPTGLGSGSSEDEGGGALRLEVSGTLELNGAIDVSGDDYTPRAGSAAGSVWIDANRLTGGGGSSYINAKGGNGRSYQPPGSGGRVAIHAQDASGWFGSVQTGGGSQSTATPQSWFGYSDVGNRSGPGGTYFFHDKSTGEATLYVSGKTGSGLTDFTNSSGTCRLGAHSVVDYNDFASFDGVIDVVVEAGACAEFVNAAPGVFRNITVRNNGRISGSGQGGRGGSFFHYGGVATAEGGASGVSGGSGGGAGLGANAVAANSDDPAQPVTPGGGGGCSVNTSGSFGGNGGGVVSFIADGVVSIEAGGRIVADGEHGNSCGGGAGGSIWIRASQINNQGIVSAVGGNGDAGLMSEGGGGGRIHLDAPVVNNLATITVSGGTGVSGAAGSGTILFNGVTQ